MSDFRVQRSSVGVEFAPISAKATDWLSTSGLIAEAVSPDGTLLREANDAATLAKSLHSAELTWADVEANAGRKPLIPSYAELTVAANQHDAERIGEGEQPPKFTDTFLGGLILYLLPVAIVGLIIIALGRQQAVPQPAPTSRAVANEPDEISIVSLCDMAVKGSLASESSYDPAMDWKYLVEDGKAEVLRKFEAKNAFGAALTSRYVCTYSIGLERIVSLKTLGPDGLTTLVGR